MDGSTFMNAIGTEMASTSQTFALSFITNNWPFLLSCVGLVIIAGFIVWAISSAFRPR